MNDLLDTPGRTPAPMRAWLIEPLETPAARLIENARRADDVQHVAVMPDVHAANDVCVGTVMATRDLLYPSAVGGDIGCGMLAVAFDAGADALASGDVAGRVLGRLASAVPGRRRHRSRVAPFPEALARERLSHGALEAARRDDGALQLGTLGGGNHFVELQADEDGRLWLMIHTGSRAMGQAVRGHHLAHAFPAGPGGLRALDARSDAGRAYVNDMAWARAYAQANREAIADAVAEVLRAEVGAQVVETSRLGCDHNHVEREEHFGEPFWVHRKGAAPAGEGAPGILPGSMGTQSFHVEGRGCAESLRSSAHGAGRSRSREAARRAFTERDLRRQMEGVWYDYRMAGPLREEAPKAYKDIRAVLRAQQDLIRVVRTLRPVLVYKSD
jgi:tRNA-splicing ligase RtcB